MGSVLIGHLLGAFHFHGLRVFLEFLKYSDICREDFLARFTSLSSIPENQRTPDWVAQLQELYLLSLPFFLLSFIFCLLSDVFCLLSFVFCLLSSAFIFCPDLSFDFYFYLGKQVGFEVYYMYNLTLQDFDKN